MTAPPSLTAHADRGACIACLGTFDLLDGIVPPHRGRPGSLWAPRCIGSNTLPMPMPEAACPRR